MKTEENRKELRTQETRGESRTAGQMQGNDSTAGQLQKEKRPAGQTQAGSRTEGQIREEIRPEGQPQIAGRSTGQLQKEVQTRRDIRRRGNQTSEAGKRRKSMPFLFITVAVFSAIVSMAAAFFYFQKKSKPGEPAGLVYEANIIQGDISGKTKEERQRELDAIVEEGMLAMSINATPSGRTAGADRTINWLIENPSNQGKLIRVEVWRDDTDEKIYETGAIPPGNYVEAAPLKVEMPPGEYRCTARFYAYSQDDESYIGQAAAQIRLVLYE